MGVTDDIISARDGVVRCGLSSHASPSISELALEFGLNAIPANYVEIDLSAAHRLIQLVLSQDLAYNSETMPADLAEDLAGRFLNEFGTEGVQFFTNGTFHETPGPHLTWSGVSWNPVTEATFDTGVLVISPKCSGCLWVEDED